jgi:hypothetical protein
MKSLFASGPFAALQEISAKNLQAWQSMQNAFTKSEPGKDDD